MVSGTVSVIDAETAKVVKTIRVGTEPFGCALTPDGQQALRRQSVLRHRFGHRHREDRVVGPSRRGREAARLAITADGKKVYVTQFLALRRTEDPRPLTQSEGADDGREGRVTVIDAVTNRVVNTVILNPLPNVGTRSGLTGARWRASRSRRVRQHHGSVPEPARIDRHSRQPRVRLRHVLVAERPVPLQRERPELPVDDRHRSRRRGVSRRST